MIIFSRPCIVVPAINTITTENLSFYVVNENDRFTSDFLFSKAFEQEYGLLYAIPVDPATDFNDATQLNSLYDNFIDNHEEMVQIGISFDDRYSGVI